IRVLDDVGSDHGREHQDADRGVRAVAHLVEAVLAARKADDVTLGELLLALGSPECRRSVDDDEPLLVRVMRVVRPQPITQLEVVRAPAGKLGTDVVAPPRILAPPAGAILLAIPLVRVEVEDLHRIEPRRRAPAARRRSRYVPRRRRCCRRREAAREPIPSAPLPDRRRRPTRQDARRRRVGTRPTPAPPRSRARGWRTPREPRRRGPGGADSGRPRAP